MTPSTVLNILMIGQGLLSVLFCFWIYLLLGLLNRYNLSEIRKSEKLHNTFVYYGTLPSLLGIILLIVSYFYFPQGGEIFIAFWLLSGFAHMPVTANLLSISKTGEILKVRWFHILAAFVSIVLSLAYVNEYPEYSIAFLLIIIVYGLSSTVLSVISNNIWPNK